MGWVNAGQDPPLGGGSGDWSHATGHVSTTVPG
jgi:hypothetical protein